MAIVCVCLLAIVVIPPPAGNTAEVFLSPQLETQVGYDSNRHRAEESVGSAFLTVQPGLEMNVFITETVEMNGLAFYRRDEFLREGFSYSQTRGATVSIRHAGVVWYSGVTVSGFTYRDEHGTRSDLTQVRCSPEIAYTSVTGALYSFAASIGEYQYKPLVASEAEIVDGFLWSLRARAQWPVSLPLSLWAEGFVEEASTDDGIDDYDGYGFVAGCGYSPPGPLNATFIVQLGAYRSDYTIQDRNDTFSATMSLSYRATTWAELHGDFGGGTFWNQTDDVNYDQWRLSIGLRLVSDFEIGHAPR